MSMPCRERRDQWRPGSTPRTVYRPARSPTRLHRSAFQAAWAGIRQSKDRGVTSYLRMIDAAIGAARYRHGGRDRRCAGRCRLGAWRHCGDDRIDRVHGLPDLTIDDLAELGRRLVS